MPHECDDEGCSELDSLRLSLNEKHAQNRKDIHDLRNKQQLLLLKQQELELKLKPIVGDGLRPGLIERMSEQITSLTGDFQKMMLSRAEEKGKKSGEEIERRQQRRKSDKLLALVGVLLVLAQVYLMVKDSRRQDTIDSLTQTIQQQNNYLHNLQKAVGP